MARRLIPLQAIGDEAEQAHCRRAPLLRRLERMLGRTVVTFFTSFSYPTLLDDKDAQMLEAMCRGTGLSGGMTLILSSAGGFGLAAERIIRACRAYTKGDFEVIVPQKAKSAATLICFGANRIWMSDTSELGPVDPQITLKEGTEYKFFSLHSIVKAYDSLFKGAVESGTRGEQIAPYLQQLEKFDAREIEEFRSAMALSEDIAVKSLKRSQMADVDDNEIRRRIRVFLTPEQVRSHDRPIGWQEAEACGLKAEYVPIRSDLWDLVQEIYLRTNWRTDRDARKIMETLDHSYVQPIAR